MRSTTPWVSASSGKPILARTRRGLTHDNLTTLPPARRINRVIEIAILNRLDLMNARKLHFTYHAYHEDSFGLYRGNRTLPDPGNANDALIDLFTKRLAARSRK